MPISILLQKDSESNPGLDRTTPRYVVKDTFSDKSIGLIIPSTVGLVYTNMFFSNTSTMLTRSVSAEASNGIYTVSSPESTSRKSKGSEGGGRPYFAIEIAR
jgi:hypothetical protein